MSECTGFEYQVNPDDPSEGTDIAHDDSCPVHPVAGATIAVAFEVPIRYVETNDDRAAMVRPFVEAYRAAFYDGEEEPMNMVLGDMIANLLHLADRLSADEVDEVYPQSAVEGSGAESVLNHADFHYMAEVQEEAEDREFENDTDTPADYEELRVAR